MDVGGLGTIGQVTVLTEKSPFDVNFYATFSSMFVIGVGIAFILLVIPSSRIFTKKLVFQCFEYVIKSLVFAL